MTRQFAETYDDWTPATVEARAETLAQDALVRWPVGPVI
jgi:hypothetical protein